MKFYLTGQKLERIDDISTVANNSVDYSTAEFIIDNPKFKDKDINTINALFQNGDTETTYTVPLADDIVTIPADALTGETLLVSLVALGDVKAYTTSQVKIKLEESGYDKTKTPSDPSASVYQQILTDLKEKQDKLTAGNNITISEDNVISSTGGGRTYSIIKDEEPETPNALSEYHLVDTTSGSPIEEGTSIVIPDQSLTAGDNIQIKNKIISATDTKYTAGENITISEDNVISSTGGTSSSDISALYDSEVASVGVNYLTGLMSNEMCMFTEGLMMFTVTGTVAADTYLVGAADNTVMSYFYTDYRYDVDKALLISTDLDISLKLSGKTEQVINKKGYIPVEAGNSSIAIKIKTNSDINVTAFETVFRLALVDKELAEYIISLDYDKTDYLPTKMSIVALDSNANRALTNSMFGDYAGNSTNIKSLNDNKRFYRKFFANYSQDSPTMPTDAPSEMLAITSENLLGVFVSYDEAQCYYGHDAEYNYSERNVYIYRLQVHYLDNGVYKSKTYKKYKTPSIDLSTGYETEWKLIEEV